jgi:uncharacterized protein YabN with tetrapyrrole methylase and pyrophosphatase domain
MARIRVVGLGGTSPQTDWESMLGDRAVYVRSAAVADRHTPPGCTYTRTFDGWLDDAERPDVAEMIARELGEASKANDLAYLVPGIASIGDGTVARLREITDVEIVAGSFDIPATRGAVTVIDALSLAEYERAAPFETGLAAIDPGSMLVVTNWIGSSVVDLAGRYLRRMYPSSALVPDLEGTVVVGPLGFRDAARSVPQLQQVVAQLRRPDGCPWDRDQTQATMMPDLVGEVAELQAAIDNADWDNAAEELGDIFLHVLMQTQIAREAERFTFHDIVEILAAKLVRRHPHVFGDVTAHSPTEVLNVWQQVKAAEKAARESTAT